MPDVSFYHYRDVNYTDYRVDFNHVIDEGTLILPVAGPPGTPPKIVRTHSPIMKKKADWVAERLGAKPEPPHWDTGSENDILVSANITPASPAVGFGHILFKCTGTYTYVSAISPDMDTMSLPMGAPVNVNRDAAQNTLDVSLFKRSVLRSPDNGRI